MADKKVAVDEQATVTEILGDTFTDEAVEESKLDPEEDGQEETESSDEEEEEEVESSDEESESDEETGTTADGEAQDESKDEDETSQGEEESPELTALRAQNEQQTVQMAELQAELQQVKVEQKQKETVLEDVEFVGEEDDLDMLFSTPANVNTLLNKVYRQGIATGREINIAEMPRLLQPHIQSKVEGHALTVEFFRDNSELREVVGFVNSVAEDMLAKNPKLGRQELFSTLADEVNKRLGRVKGNGKKPTVKKKSASRNTGLVGGTKGRKPTPKQMSDVEKTLSDLIDE